MYKYRSKVQEEGKLRLCASVDLRSFLFMEELRRGQGVTEEKKTLIFSSGLLPYWWFLLAQDIMLGNSIICCIVSMSRYR